jgi:hypothetical protein
MEVVSAHTFSVFTSLPILEFFEPPKNIFGPAKVFFLRPSTYSKREFFDADVEERARCAGDNWSEEALTQSVVKQIAVSENFILVLVTCKILDDLCVRWVEGMVENRIALFFFKKRNEPYQNSATTWCEESSSSRRRLLTMSD